MFSKDRSIAVMSGFVFFLGGLYLFALMSAEINIHSFIVLIGFAVVSLYLAAAIGQSMSESKHFEINSNKDNEAISSFEFQEKLGRLKAENLRLSKIIDSDLEKAKIAAEVSGAPFMLRQRAFIHDVAGPISIAQGMIEMALKTLESEPQNTEQVKAKLEKAMVSVSRISKKIQENRDYLIMSAS